MLVDEALDFTVVVETTRDALPTIRKHLDSMDVPLLTPGSVRHQRPEVAGVAGFTESAVGLGAVGTRCWNMLIKVR